MKIYTRKGDDGTTGLLFGGRVAKNGPQPTAYGVVDEAQAFVALARAEVEQGSDLDHMLVHLERDLWVLMAELATDPTRLERIPAVVPTGPVARDVVGVRRHSRPRYGSQQIGRTIGYGFAAPPWPGWYSKWV